MNVIQVTETRFETRDGERFETVIEAAKHELALAVDEMEPDMYTDLRETILDFLVSNAPAVHAAISLYQHNLNTATGGEKP